MQTQLLIVDTIRTWQYGRLGVDESTEELELDYARLTLVTKEPEYYGNAEFEMRIFWDTHSSIDDTHPRNKAICDLMRSFAHCWKLTYKVIRHEGLTTFVEFKTTSETINHSGFDWKDVAAPKPDPV